MLTRTSHRLAITAYAVAGLYIALVLTRRRLLE